MSDEAHAAGQLWDDDAFRRRVIDLAKERGLSITDVCRGAGVSVSYLAKPAGKSGRSVEALLGIARALNISLIELIGVHDVHDSAPTDENLARMALVAEIAALLYVALAARPHIPTGINTVELVSEILRRIERAGSEGKR